MAFNHVMDYEDEDHYSDVFLTNADVQALSSAHELIRFFSKLHFHILQR